MQNRLSLSLNLLVAALISISTHAFAKPAADTPYFTDGVNSYVQDQVSKDMEELNSYLCFVGAMAPNLMVNGGDYIAMVDQKICNPDTTGSQVGVIDNSFFSSQVNSTRESNTAPMLTKVWLDNFIDINNPKTPPISIPLYLSATQAPSATLPFGVFRLDYCKFEPGNTNSACKNQLGYIDSTKTGLDFYTLNRTGPLNEFFQEFALHLSANSTAKTGSGIVIKTNNLVTDDNPNGEIVTSSTVFAHNADYFYRDDGTNNPQCFRRSINLETFPDEHVWRYGLYHADQGTRIELSPSRAIEYVYSSNNKSNTGKVGETYNGSIGYRGLSIGGIGMPTGETVSHTDNSTFPPVKTPYTIRKPDGHLLKYTSYATDLPGFLTANYQVIAFYPSHDVTGWDCPPNLACVATTVMAAITPSIFSSSYYNLLWSTTWGRFEVKEYCYLSIFSFSYVCSPPVATGTVRIASNTSIFDAQPYDVKFTYRKYSAPRSKSYTLYNATIYRSEFAKLNTLGSINPRVHFTSASATVVPWSDYATLNNGTGGLKCMGKCPTSLQLANGPYTPPAEPFAGFFNITYSLNPTTGNMHDMAPVSTSIAGGSSVAQPGITTTATGKLVTEGVRASIVSNKPACTSPCYRESDIDLYNGAANNANYYHYVWETNAIIGNNAAVLLDANLAVVNFYPPLPVTFAVPDTVKFGSSRATNATLYYGTFGSLYGIPDKCIDTSSNQPCVVDDPLTPNINEQTKNPRFVSEYSIPFGFETPTSTSAIGTVTANIAQGDPAKGGVTLGQKLLVKALEKEIRLSRVTLDTCKIQGLAQPITVSKLPNALDWIDPKEKIGVKPVLNPQPAPRIIHGVDTQK